MAATDNGGLLRKKCLDASCSPRAVMRCLPYDPTLVLTPGDAPGAYVPPTPCPNPFAGYGVTP